MSDFSDNSGAVFFLADDSRSEDEILELANVSEIRRDASLGLMAGEWRTGAGDSIWSRTEDHERVLIRFLREPDMRIFTLEFYRAWWAALAENHRRAEVEGELPLERDVLLPLATAFRDVCQALSPIVALITPRRKMLEGDEIAKYAEWIREDNADRLLGRGFAMLYVSERLEAELHSSRLMDARELFPVARGSIAFHGSGPNRW